MATKPLAISQEAWQMETGRLGVTGDVIVGTEMVGGDNVVRLRIVQYTRQGGL